MKNLIIIFLLLIISCSSNPTSPSSPEVPAGPVIIPSAKITNFYLKFAASSLTDSHILYQVSVENDGSDDLAGIIIKLHGYSCRDGANHIWEDTLMQTYTVDIDAGSIVTPPRAGYISSYVYNNCQMILPQFSSNIYDVNVEVYYGSDLLDSWTKTFTINDVTTVIGSETYI